MEHRLLTVMFVDMQGYTRRSAEQTIDEMKLFHDELRDFVQKSIEGHDGTLVKSLGDGFLVRFDTPTRAVQAGLELQKRIETRNQNILNPEKFVRFRIGINTGEVGIDEQGDLFGDPVNIASRIQSFAEPNAVFISESTYLAMNRNEFGAQDLGPQEFKNATREIRVYKIQGKMVGPGASASPAASVARQAARAEDKPSAGDSRKKFALIAVVVLAISLPLAGWGLRKLFRKMASRASGNAPAAAAPAAVPDRPAPDQVSPSRQDPPAPGERSPARPNRGNRNGREISPEMLDVIFKPLSVDLENARSQVPRHLRQPLAKLQRLVARNDFRAAWQQLDEMEARVPRDEHEIVGKLSIAFTRVEVARLAGRSTEAREILEKISQAEPNVPPPLKEGFTERIRELGKQLGTD